MAIKIGKKSEEGSFKLYQGVAAFNVIAVNPNKEALSDITGKEVEEEPVYTGKDDNGNDFVRIVFWLKTNQESQVNNGIELTTSASFTLTKAQRVGQNSGKIQIIDKYGRTAWATPEEVNSKTIPQYKNGPANIDRDYRPACQGEEYLVDFLIQWLNIPNPANYKDGKWVMKNDPSDSEVSLNIAELFKGNVNEISELVAAASPYLVKGALGVRTTEDNKQYHQVFTRMFVKNAVTNYSKLDAAIADFKANGGAANVEYATTPLHEYKVEATDFASTDPLSAESPSTQASPWDNWGCN